MTGWCFGSFLNPMLKCCFPKTGMGCCGYNKRQLFQPIGLDIA
jgi:hypothetical protein